MKVSSRLLLILGILFWSGNYVMGRAVVAVVPPITLAYLRWLVALIVFLPFSYREVRESWDFIRKEWRFFTLMGMTGVLGFNIFQYLAVKETTAINATLINAAGPVFTAVAAYVFLKNKLSFRQITGIVISFLGVIAIITGNHPLQLADMTLNRGDLMMLGAVLVNTVYLLTLRTKGTQVSPRLLFTASVMLGLVAAFPLPVLENIFYRGDWLANLRPAHFLSLIYLGIFPTILSMLFFNRAILDMGPVKTSIYLNLSIVFTSILGYIFLGEGLELPHLLGGSLVVTGVWLTNTARVDDGTAVRKG